jgi:hypothetical protein
VPSRAFRIGEVGKSCGIQDLYFDVNHDDPMRMEHLFSKLESKTATIFQKVKSAVANGLESIELWGKDIHTLFKFMNISPRRSEQYRNNVNDPHRENDFIFRRQEETARQSGMPDGPTQVWLAQLLYLLETCHDELVADSEATKDNVAAKTYQTFVEDYTLQIWKAADGYEFFLNDRLVDFEGDTEQSSVGQQLIWMTTEGFIHLVLPVSPEITLVFCNESRCWESPFADTLKKMGNPYPTNSRLKRAPYKDIINVHIPSQKRGRKRTWPATEAWRINVGTLSGHHHQIIASYSLNHARSVVVARRRARFERACRDLEKFNKDRIEVWKSQGHRIDYQNVLGQPK